MLNSALKSGLGLTPLGGNGVLGGWMQAMLKCREEKLAQGHMPSDGVAGMDDVLRVSGTPLFILQITLAQKKDSDSICVS